jgi:GTP pyrophosphokinase
MEDTAFKITNAEDYYRIEKLLNDQIQDPDKNIDKYAAIIKKELDKEGIQAKITGRTKHIYSIYRKMQRKGIPLDAVYDIRALRVLVDTEADCYRVLSVIHNIWEPVKGQLDDYISNPKPNGYQSLHTAVYDKNRKILEVQIRTLAMHEESELGIAAHWRYKEQNGSTIHVRKKKDLDAEIAIQEKISWLRMLMDESSTENGVVKKEPVGIKDEEKPIFVFTPAGDVIRLPQGATPVDFAYRIHTELGHRCSGGKVNGRIVPLDHQLSDGDTVEIITRKRDGPNIQWLSKDQRYVKTKDARRKINSWFRQQRRKDDITQGHEILDRELAKLGLKSSIPYEQVATAFNLDTTDELLVQIGSSSISADKLNAVLSGQVRPSKDDRAREAEKELVTLDDEIKTLIEKEPSGGKKPAKQGLLVASTEGLHSRIAKCCNPVPPEKIVGYVTRGHGVTIHVHDCPNVLNEVEQERIIPASWGDTDSQSYPVMVMVEAINRQGLLGDIGQAVARENVDISEAKVKKKAHWAIFELILEVNDADQLERVMQKLTETKGVRLAYRRKG